MDFVAREVIGVLRAEVKLTTGIRSLSSPREDFHRSEMAELDPRRPCMFFWVSGERLCFLATTHVQCLDVSRVLWKKKNGVTSWLC